jgi:hypothetical protein
VELIDEENVQEALKCHNKHMGNRYIEGLYLIVVKLNSYDFTIKHSNINQWCIIDLVY